MEDILHDHLKALGRDIGKSLCACKVDDPLVCVEIPEKESGWVHYTRTRPAARKLIENLQNGVDVPHAHTLPGCLPTPPEDLRRYLTSVVEKGAEVADAEMYEDDIKDAPGVYSRWMSGGTQICHLKSWKNAAFFGSIFHHIQINSPTDVELATWDLFHGHMFVHVASPNQNKICCDLGILFHAKEFPLEYRRNNLGKVIPIGHTDAGGGEDVRMGSKCSIKQPEYYLRNYLWLLSTNQVVVLDTHSDDLAGIIQNMEFHTVGSFYFKQVGDINYFPPKSFTGSVVNLLAEKERDHLRNYVDGDAKDKDSKLNVGERIEFMGKMDKNRWFAAQVTHLIASSKETARFIFATPRAHLASPTLRIKQAIDGVRRQISRLDSYRLQDLENMLILTNKTEEKRRKNAETAHTRSTDDERERDAHTSLIFSRRIPPSARHFVLNQINEEKKTRQKRLNRSNSMELEKLLRQGIDKKDATAALSLTRSNSTGLLSAFRAQNLLQASFSKYRPEFLCESFGSDDYEMKRVAAYQAHAFYAASTLRAMLLDKIENIGPMAAGAKVAKIVALETHQKWETMRKRRGVIVETLGSKGMSDKLIQIMYHYEVEP